MTFKQQNTLTSNLVTKSALTCTLYLSIQNNVANIFLYDIKIKIVFILMLYKLKSHVVKHLEILTVFLIVLFKMTRQLLLYKCMILSSDQKLFNIVHVISVISHLTDHTGHMAWAGSV